MNANKIYIDKLNIIYFDLLIKISVKFFIYNVSISDYDYFIWYILKSFAELG